MSQGKKIARRIDYHVQSCTKNITLHNDYSTNIDKCQVFSPLFDPLGSFAHNVFLVFFRPVCIKNARNTKVLLRFFPCQTKNIIANPESIFKLSDYSFREVYCNPPKNVL